MTGAVADAGGIKVTEGDRRFAALSRGFNPRWRARPDYIRLVSDGSQVRHALEEAVNEPVADPARRRITVRSGGHCYEDFVCADDVRVIIDMSLMDRVQYDPALDAVCVDAGVTNGDLRRKLFLKTGRVLPGGSCPSVGIGGHIPVGGFGLLSRQHGLTVDYLYGVEVAVVGADRRVRLVTATRDSRDRDLRRLWWAHTGGGGGNFGIVTKFWFRDLPQAPEKVLFTASGWKWSTIDKERFRRIVRNFGRFFAEHRGPGPYDPLFAILQLTHSSQDKIGLIVQIDAGVPDAEKLLTDFLNAMNEGVGVDRHALSEAYGEYPAFTGLHAPIMLPWDTVEKLFGPVDNLRAGKHKSAYMVEPLPDDQIDALWAGLAEDAAGARRDAVVQIDSYGGAINRLRPGQTAARQRSSILKLQHQVYWPIAESGEGHLRWIRTLYRNMYRRTGGVPLPLAEQPGSPVTDGCYIGYPDVDLGDPEWNTSDVPWPALYYGEDYAVLRQVKDRWDPLNIFHHRQSVEPLRHSGDGAAEPGPIGGGGHAQMPEEGPA
ncbi:FAD-binding oxidoreductase [Thermomonospora umbrina]|uniref:FAD/FMN-containing dehydrogenase n=1 Tax=Thermomonospora umbrina TaxID=111806 RepID=A0A3D9SM18_9ACTN|nr:FAD-binding oxidoreductase [Thermomonospora umbrina]REE95450.1 FAD/FMN-containing dehydrogenase [Thermomonospora umbrina]